MQLVAGRISILICTLNRSALSERAVRSALEQTYKDLEVIVSDDASTDDTLPRLQAIQDPRLKVFAQRTRLGIVENPNFALGKATGEFLIFMGDDDALLPTAFEKLVAPFLGPDGKAVGMTWCPCTVADGDGERLWETEPGPREETVVSMLTAMFAGDRGPRCSSIVVRTAEALEVGGYEAKYGALSDIGNWGRAALRGGSKSICVQEPLVIYTMHQGNITRSSSIVQWQSHARLVLTDMIALMRHKGDEAAARQLQHAEKDFISGITFTILIQRIGVPGWIRNAMAETLRFPRAIFSAYTFRRLLKDGRKTFVLRRATRRKRKAQAVPASA